MKNWREYFLGRRPPSLLTGRRWEAALHLLVCFAATALLIVLGVLCMAGLLWARTKLPPVPPDGGRAEFEHLYAKWSAMGAVAANIFWSLTLCFAVVTLCHQYRGEGRTAAIRALSAVLAVLLLAFYSETELGAALCPAAFRTVIVAHRAGATFAPENTLAALERAIRAGADMAEIDVQQTRDGVLIVMHDSDFWRTTGLSRKVWDVDYGAVRALDAGGSFSPFFSGEPVPTLAEMLAAAKGRIPLMIELKATGHERGYVEETVREIRAAGMEAQCVVGSMNLDLLRRCKALAPEIGTVYITWALISGLELTDDVDAYSIEMSYLTAETVSRVHAAGKQIYAWTANTGDSMKNILRLEADGLVTDNPELAQFYQEYAQKDFFLENITDLLYPEPQKRGKGVH